MNLPPDEYGEEIADTADLRDRIERDGLIRAETPGKRERARALNGYKMQYDEANREACLNCPYPSCRGRCRRVTARAWSGTKKKGMEKKDVQN